MLIKFSGKDNILDSKPFTDDEVQFNLLQLIRESESPHLFTNRNKSIIIGQSAPKYPAWIWTAKEIPKEDINELKNDFVELYKNSDILTFVAKPHIAEELAEYYLKFSKRKYYIYLQMESFKCSEVIEPKSKEGFLAKAKMEDINVISEFLSGFIYDCFGKVTTPEQQVETAKVYIERENLYVWRNGNKIISMANIAHNSKRYTRLNEVYTRLEMRGKGFASMLVSEISKIILNEGRLPILYTDLRNPASNRAYKNVGFKECGKVNQILFDQKVKS